MLLEPKVPLTLLLPWLVSVAALSTSLTAQSFQLSSQVPIGFELGHQSIPVWNGGALTVVPHDGSGTPLLHFISTKGGEDPSIPFTMPGSPAGGVVSVVQSPDGRTAVAGWAFDENGKRIGFMTLISADRQTMTSVPILTYRPYFVRFASDGTIWTLGLEMINANPNAKAIDQSHHLIRQFDRTGKQIASYVPKNSLSDLNRFDLSNDIMSGMFATGQDRVGWYAPWGNRYYELSSDGTLTQYPGIPQNPDGEMVTGMALIDSGLTIVSAKDQVYSLDRKSKTWSAISLPGVNQHPVVYGASGNSMATMGKDWGSLAFWKLQYPPFSPSTSNYTPTEKKTLIDSRIKENLIAPAGKSFRPGESCQYSC